MKKISLSTKELRKIVLDRLEKESGVEVKDLQLSQGNDAIGIEGEMSARGFDVGFKGELVNSADTIVLDNPDIRANFLAKGMIKSRLSEAPEFIQNFLEKKYGKKISKMHITKAGLNLEME